MTEFRENMGKAMSDPYTVVMRSKKLPLGLLNDAKYAKAKPNLLTTESFEATFGPKAQRKKPRSAASLMTDMEQLVKHAQDSAGLISSPLLIIYLHVFDRLNFFAVFLVWV